MHNITSGLASHLTLWHFPRSIADSCTFIFTDPRTKHFAILAFTIDDFLAISDDQQLLDQVKAQLRTKYTLQDLGPVKNILNWRVDRD